MDGIYLRQVWAGDPTLLLDRGAVEVRGDGTFAVVVGKIKAAVRELTALLLTLQAEGDRAQAKKLLAELGVVRPPVQKALDRLAAVPVDIEPIFVTAQELVR